MGDRRPQRFDARTGTYRSFWRVGGSIGFPAFITCEVLKGRLPLNKIPASEMPSVVAFFNVIPFTVHSLKSQTGMFVISKAAPPFSIVQHELLLKD